MTTGTKLIVILTFLVALGLLTLARSTPADPPRVTISTHQNSLGEYVECHVPKDSLNRWLDVIIEDHDGEGYDLQDTDRTSYTLNVRRPLDCPGPDVDAVRASCELMWFNLLTGHMVIQADRANLSCEH